MSRPAGGPLFAKLTKGDVVIAPKLDRLFRSALDALKVVEALRDRDRRVPHARRCLPRSHNALRG
jgi:DNA invertase Pin-like site-specific DNA recombinase